MRQDQEKQRPFVATLSAKMNQRDLASNIAQSVAGGAWSQDQIAAVIEKRLPTAKKQLATPIAQKLLQHLPLLYAPDPKRIATVLPHIKEFNQLYRYCNRKNVWPAPFLDPPRMSPIAAFADLQVPEITGSSTLIDFLYMSPGQLDYYADPQSRHELHGDFAVNHDIYETLKKRGGGNRIIEAPKSILKSTQRLILRCILENLPSHDSTFGFVKGRNCLDAAKRHCAEDVVVAFDLKDFFPSIGSQRVFGIFRCLGYPLEVSRYLTAFCTTVTPPRILNKLAPHQRQLYRRPHLPQGAPTSPALANHVAFGLDRRLAGLAQRMDAQYTRYADDMSFSGDRVIAPILKKAVPAIIQDEGFQLNAQKTRVAYCGSRQTVTGVVVNQHLNISRQRYDHLKAIIHACGRPEDTRLDDREFRATLLGQISWVETVNFHRGQKLRGLLEKATSKN